MSVLGRYVLQTVMAYTGLVTLVFAALGALFLFIGEQGDIGVGSYTAAQALAFVGLNLPGYLFQLLPVAALIGALLGLGNLARGSELVVMRASGISTVRLCAWLGLAGVVLATAIYVGGELVAPPLGQYARQMKAFSKFSDMSLAGNDGVWVRDGDTIISVHDQSARAHFGGVLVFKFGPDRRLLSVGRADSARVGATNLWTLDRYAETGFGDAGTRAETAAQKHIVTTVSPDFIGLAVVDADVMGLRDLQAYVAHLQGNSLDARHFQVAFWARIARLAAVVLVVILALPFALIPMRSSAQGARAVIGILVGAGFILLSQLLENGGQLLNLAPWLVGWLPTALLAAFTSVLLWRTR
jgi:lipopolysaccharide export system permease protein